MCKSKKELNKLVKQYKELKLAKEQIETELSAVRDDIVAYMLVHGESDGGFEGNKTVTYIGPSYKLQYITVCKENIDRALLKQALGPVYSNYVSPSISHQLRVS